MAVYPIPAGRTSDALLSRRLLTQLQAEQKRLLEVEQQLGTGRRIQLPGEDSSAAGRAIALQQFLESNAQLRTNLSTGQSHLSATDTALSGVAGLLADARGLAVLAADSTTSSLEREALALEVESTINQMLVVGNYSFRGRYLFAGTDSTTPPFASIAGSIAYLGNDVTFRTPGDAGLLFETNVPGQDLFGAVSAEVRGIDLRPVLTETTRLSDLRGGLGISTGSILVSDGTGVSIVSLAGARSVGDVARLIQASPPPGRELHVTVGPRGLVLDMDAGGGGHLVVRDMPGSTTAAELGIVRLQGGAGEPIVGEDLDPTLRPTSRLSDVLGVRARAVLHSAGAHNDLVVESRERGSAGNGFQIQLVDDDLLQAAPGVAAGNEYAVLDDTARAAQAGLRLSGLHNDLIVTAVQPGAQWNNVRIEIEAGTHLGNAAQVTLDTTSRTLRIAVDDTDETTVGAPVAALNTSGYFTAASDPSLGEDYDPSAPVLALDAGLRGNTGNSGGEAHTIYVHVEAGQTTANQVMAAWRANPQIDELFEIQLEPRDSTSTALAGSRAVDLAAAGVTQGGTGIEWDQQAGLQVTNGGKTHTIDLSGAETVEDLLNVLNSSSAMLLAEINGDRTGINVRSRLSGSDFSIGENGGTTATDLGLRTFHRGTPLSQLNYREGVHAVPGTDFLIRRNDGVELEIDVSAVRGTIGDVLDLINQHPGNLDPDTAVVARLRAYGNGLELVDDHPVGTESLAVLRASGSTAAWELGLIPWGEERSPSVSEPAQPAVARLLFPHPYDTNTAVRLTATQLGTGLNGVDIELHNAPVGNAPTVTFDPVGHRLVIEMEEGQTTANSLVAAILAEGTFRAELDTTNDPTNDGTGTLIAPPGVAARTAAGSAEALTGRDTNPLEAEGVFNSLIRLRDAIARHDVEAMQRIVEMLDADHDRLNLGRASIGVRNQGLDALQIRNEDDELQLKAALSDEIDIDLAEAISQLTARQAAYEASLRAIGSLFQLSLLDFM